MDGDRCLRFTATVFSLWSLLAYPAAARDSMSTPALAGEPASETLELVELLALGNGNPDASLSRVEYVDYLDAGLSAVDRELQAFVEQVVERCDELNNMTVLWADRVDQLQQEAEQAMAEVESSQPFKAAAGKDSADSFEAVSEAAIAPDIARNLDFLHDRLGVDLRSPDGVFRANQPLSHQELVYILNVALGEQLAELIPQAQVDSLFGRVYRELAALEQDYASARQQLTDLKEANPLSWRSKSNLRDIDNAVSPHPGIVVTIADMDESHPAYDSVTTFMVTYSVDLRLEGDRFAPEQPLTRGQLLDDLLELVYFQSSPFGIQAWGHCERNVTLDQTVYEIQILREQVQAIEYDIRSLISAGNQF
jgi:hypothetical protein